MITLSHEQLEKINLLDKLFTSLSVEQLKELIESDLIVAKLKGVNDNPQIILNLVHSYDTMRIDLISAQSSINSLKEDFQSLLRVLYTEVFTPRYNQEFTNLKSKHGLF